MKYVWKINMINLESLKNELVGFEGDIFDLDNKMISLGFYSESDSDWNELLESKCVNYVLNTGQCVEDKNILIYFIVTDESRKDECIESSYINVINISEN